MCLFGSAHGVTLLMCVFYRRVCGQPSPAHIWCPPHWAERWAGQVSRPKQKWSLQAKLLQASIPYRVMAATASCFSFGLVFEFSVQKKHLHVTLYKMTNLIIIIIIISVAGIKAHRQWKMKIREFSQTHQSRGSWGSASLSERGEGGEALCWLAVALGMACNGCSSFYLFSATNSITLILLWAATASGPS